MLNGEGILHRHNSDPFVIARMRMVQKLAGSGIFSEKLLNAFRTVPRHLFVSDAFHYRAYEDTPLPIGYGQTMSRPTTVARLIEGLNITRNDHVLEIGTGSGYQSAILASLAAHVTSVEIIEGLLQRAKDLLLNHLGYRNIQLLHSSQYSFKEKQYDAIIVSACAEEIPQEYLNLLAFSGRMMIPLKKGAGQVLLKITKDEKGNVLQKECGNAFFVQLVRY